MDGQTRSLRASLPAPYSMAGTLTSAGTLLGFGIGLALLQRAGGYRPSGPAWKRAMCLALGLVGTLTLYIA